MKFSQKFASFAFTLSFLLAGLGLSPSLAAPYPPTGLEIDWRQPNGDLLTLRVFGDELSGRTATLDGYTVVFDPDKRAYFYAQLSADGNSLVPTSRPAEKAPPAGLAKNLRAAKSVTSAQREILRKKRGLASAPLAKKGNQAQAEAVHGNPVSGTKVGLLILVQFPDDPSTSTADPINFPVTQAKVERYANEVGYHDDGNLGSIRDYFNDQSLGNLTLRHLVTPVVTLPHPRNYYNFKDFPTKLKLADSYMAGYLLVKDAISKLQLAGFDFSGLTLDEDNKVIATSVLFAGKNSGVWSDGLWPHAGGLGAGVNVGTETEPRYISAYQISNQTNSAPLLGTMCHELGHLVLKYPDLYDTDTDDGDSEGVGEHSLMASGSYLGSQKAPAPIDLFLKDWSGWASITDVLPSQLADMTLPATGNVGIRIKNPLDPEEYFLLENRDASNKWGVSSRDKGVIIWHVDESVESGNKRQQATPSEHYRISVVQADGRLDLELNKNRGDSTDFFDLTKGKWNDASLPHANWWSGEPSGISVDFLTKPQAVMSLRFGSPLAGTQLYPSLSVQEVPKLGGTFEFTVKANVAWKWVDNATWVTSTETLVQTGEQTFTYNVIANPTNIERRAILSLVSGSVVRQHLIVQAGSNADDHGNDLSDATVVINKSSTITKGKIETGGDKDRFRLEIATPGILHAESTGYTDLVGRIQDSTGKDVMVDDESGKDSNFLLGVDLVPGTYYIQVEAWDPKGTGPYSLITKFTAKPVLSLSSLGKTVLPMGSSAGFTVNANSVWGWNFEANDAKDWIDTMEDCFQFGKRTFTYTAKPNPSTTARTAVIVIWEGLLGYYHQIYQPGRSPDDYGDTMATANSLPTKAAIKGNLEGPGDNDVFLIQIPVRGSLTVASLGFTDTLGRLLDSGGNELEWDDDDGVDTNFLITRTLEPGGYYLKLSHNNSSGAGAYVLATSFKAVPLPVSMASNSSGANLNVFNVTNAGWAAGHIWESSGSSPSLFVGDLINLPSDLVPGNGVTSIVSAAKSPTTSLSHIRDGNGLLLTCEGLSQETTYFVEESADLKSWHSIATIPSGLERHTLSLPMATNRPAGYYRLVK